MRLPLFHFLISQESVIVVNFFFIIINIVVVVVISIEAVERRKEGTKKAEKS